MNLITDPWVPILDNHGERRLVGLGELFEDADAIRDLSVGPTHRVALMRLLVCVAHAALDGPTDEEDWSRCRGRIVPAVRQYLRDHRDSFELHGPRPWLQAVALQPQHNATLDKLDFSLASGNNPTFFDHAATPQGRPHDDAWCALNLLTFQCFSPGGLIGSTTWNGVKTARSSEHSPAIEGSALHTLLRGPTLLSTIWQNLVTREQIDALPGMVFGRPVWESRNCGLPEQQKEATSSFLGRLVPFSRAIRLHPQERRMTLANGFPYPKLPRQREIAATVVLSKKDKKETPTYIPVSLDRHPWRSLSSILQLATSALTGGPLCLAHLSSTSDTDTLDVWTGGLAVSRAKILDAAEWVFALPLRFFGSAALRMYERGVQLADAAELCLRRAMERYYGFFGFAKPLYARGTTWFWSELDGRHERLIEAVAGSGRPLGETWYPIVRTVVEEAYAAVCPRMTPRQIQAFALGRQELRLHKPEE
jgi:CRISPR system Cascade subunit CasA